jgi:hypothetical protein
MFRIVLASLIVIGLTIPIAAQAQNRHGHNNYYNNNSNYYNNGGYRNENRWHNPRGYRNRHSNGYGYRNNRNNDITGIIIGGVILNELFRNNNRRRHVQQCYDVRNYYFDHYGNRVEYFQRQCN